MSRHRPDRHSLEARRNAGTCLAMFGLIAVAAGLFGLAVVVMPDLALAVVVLGVLVGFMFFHYITWGWWLSRPRPGDVVADEADEPRRTYDPHGAAGDFGDD